MPSSSHRECVTRLPSFKPLTVAYESTTEILGSDEVEATCHGNDATPSFASECKCERGVPNVKFNCGEDGPILDEMGNQVGLLVST